jgi:hypothetical protein
LCESSSGFACFLVPVPPTVPGEALGAAQDARLLRFFTRDPSASLFLSRTQDLGQRDTARVYNLFCSIEQSDQHLARGFNVVSDALTGSDAIACPQTREHEFVQLVRRPVVAGLLQEVKIGTDL